MDLFPQLYTKRLILRKMEIEDIPSLVKYANNKKIADYIINIPYPYYEPDAAFRMSYVVQGFKKKARYVFAIVLKESDELIGEISLHFGNDKQRAELGYWLGEPFWNQGITTEAIAAILEFGFDTLELKEVFASCHVDNKASGKVLLNNGMIEQAVSGNVIQYRLTK